MRRPQRSIRETPVLRQRILLGRASGSSLTPYARRTTSVASRGATIRHTSAPSRIRVCPRCTRPSVTSGNAIPLSAITRSTNAGRRPGSDRVECLIVLASPGRRLSVIKYQREIRIGRITHFRLEYQVRCRLASCPDRSFRRLAGGTKALNGRLHRTSQGTATHRLGRLVRCGYSSVAYEPTVRCSSRASEQVTIAPKLANAAPMSPYPHPTSSSVFPPKKLGRIVPNDGRDPPGTPLRVVAFKPLFRGE